MIETKQKNRKVAAISYPAYMLITGKPCLVVGGGRVSLRKVEKLVNCGATVTVIAKSFIPKLQSLADSGKITLIKRSFRVSDINKEYRLVFATTDDKALNKKITESCNQKGIFICAVDANWVDGAFITPASFSKDGITVAIATGGRSCRRSKLIKEHIHRHFTALELSELLIIGIDHNTLPLDQHEGLHPDAANTKLLAEMLNGISGIHEFFILNTCNRFEIIALAHDSETLRATILKLMGLNHLSPDQYYLKSGYDAFKHTSLMLAGLLSQNIGETYIVAQIKESLKSAKKEHLCDGVIQDWIDKSLHISKNIRNKLLLSKTKEVDERVDDYLAGAVQDPSGKTAAILGTGKIGTALCGRLSKMNFKKILIFYRTRKPKLDNQNNIEILQLDELHTNLKKIDVLISALNTTTPIITTTDIKKLGTEKRTFIDLGTPRNIAEPENSAVTVLNLTDIQNSMNRKQRNSLTKKAALLVDDQMELFTKIMDSLK
jgi:glutamyl-tRNA reductase